MFDDVGKSPRDQLAPPGPLLVYGLTKLAGEILIRASGYRHVVLRTSWVYAAPDHNFIKTMKRLLDESEALSVMDDQVGAPTGEELFVNVTGNFMRTLTEACGENGAFYRLATGAASRLDFARVVNEWARTTVQSIKVSLEGVLPTPSWQYPAPAARPLNSRFWTGNLTQIVSLDLPYRQLGLGRMLREICSR